MATRVVVSRLDSLGLTDKLRGHTVAVSASNIDDPLHTVFTPITAITQEFSLPVTEPSTNIVAIEEEGLLEAPAAATTKIMNDFTEDFLEFDKILASNDYNDNFLEPKWNDMDDILFPDLD